MAKNEEKRDETPTRLTHVNGATVSVPAYKAESLLAGGLFAKPQARSSK